MIPINIPGGQSYKIEHLVLDYNGTIASDGIVIQDALPLLSKLSKNLSIHIITADTHGDVKKQMSESSYTVHIIGSNNQDEQKLDYVSTLGVEKVVTIGNGRNDMLMLEGAALGIGILQTEGGFGKTLLAADVVCTSIVDGLNLLLLPARLIATLRN